MQLCEYICVSVCLCKWREHWCVHVSCVHSTVCFCIAPAPSTPQPFHIYVLLFNSDLKVTLHPLWIVRLEKYDPSVDQSLMRESWISGDTYPVWKRISQWHCTINQPMTVVKTWRPGESSPISWFCNHNSQLQLHRRDCNSVLDCVYQGTGVYVCGSFLEGFQCTHLWRDPTM